jgi:hypothetical protein
MSSNGKLLGTVLSLTSNFSDTTFLTITLELIALNLLPSIVGKGSISLSHFVNIFTPFNSCSSLLRSVAKFSSQLLSHTGGLKVLPGDIEKECLDVESGLKNYIRTLNNSSFFEGNKFFP